MPAIKLPNSELRYGWVRGEDFWGGPLNDNLILLDGMLHLVIESLSITAPPPAAVDGQVYIVPAGATGDWLGQQGAAALRVEGAWRFYPPMYGWRARVRSLNGFYWYDGAVWRNEQTGVDPGNPGGGDTPSHFDVAVTSPDNLLADDLVLHIPILTTVILPPNMAGSAFDIIEPAPLAAALRVYRNGVQVGLIYVEAGSFSATFSTSSTTGVTFAAGDRLTVRGPETPVIGFREFGFTLRFNVVG